MKKKNLFTLLLFTLMGVIASTSFTFSESDVMTAEANIFADSISIEVPDHIFIRDIAKGFITNDSDMSEIIIYNIGTTDVTITPRLEDSSEKIFNYTYFKRIKSEDPVRIGEFSLDILRPANFGGKRSKSCYIGLDLRNYPYEITEDMPAHKSNIIFWATAY